MWPYSIVTMRKKKKPVQKKPAQKKRRRKRDQTLQIKSIGIKKLTEYSTGIYVITQDSPHSKGKIQVKVGGSRASIIRRLNRGYSLCFLSKGYWLLFCYPTKRRQNPIRLEHKLHHILRTTQGVKCVNSSVRYHEKSEWYEVKYTQLKQIMKDFQEEHKKKFSTDIMGELPKEINRRIEGKLVIKLRGKVVRSVPLPKNVKLTGKYKKNKNKRGNKKI